MVNKLNAKDSIENKLLWNCVHELELKISIANWDSVGKVTNYLIKE